MLYEASSSGDPAVIGLLLEYGADANEAKHTGHMPIHRVAHRGHLQYSAQSVCSFLSLLGGNRESFPLTHLCPSVCCSEL